MSLEIAPNVAHHVKFTLLHPVLPATAVVSLLTSSSGPGMIQVCCLIACLVVHHDTTNCLLSSLSHPKAVLLHGVPSHLV